MPVRELDPEEEVLAAPTTVRELRPDEEVVQEQEPPPPAHAFARSANVGIAEGLGAPVDLANFLLGLGRSIVETGPVAEAMEAALPSPVESFGGSQSIRRGFAALGMAPPVGEDDPDSLAGSIGRVTGAAATFLLPVGPAAKTAQEVTALTRAAPTTIRGAVVQDIGRTAVETPGRFLAAEAVSAAGAGAVGFVAREKFPDSEAASFIGEIVGGIAPVGAIAAARLTISGIGIRLARFIAKPFTRRGGEQRAARRVQEAARDPRRAADELAAPEALPEAGLTPAQQTGDEGLLSLERAVIDSSEKLKGEADEQIAEATTAIRESLGDLGEGVSPERTAAALEEAQNYMRSLVDTRMRIAARAADEKIAALGPGAAREEANIIAREELQKALKDIRAQERELWNAVPEDVILKTENSRKAFAALLKDTPLAQREDIPSIAGRLLGKDENVPEGFEAAFEAFGLTQKGARLGEKTTVAELQGLRSKLLEESRKARAAGEFNKARMADDLADAVLTDLGAQRDEIVGEAGDALRTALDFSADLNQRFTKGPVGRLLGSDRTGAPKTPEALTLERVVGQGGPRAREETRRLLEAADTPALRASVEDFLLDDFQRRAVREGAIDSKKAQAFPAKHQDLLEDFPELRSRFESAIEADDLARLRTEQAEGLAKRLNDPKISRAAVFLKEPVEGAMDRIFKSGNPEKTMREIVKLAGRDTTGDARKGLKTAFGDFLLEKASTRTATAEGEFLVSGAALKRLLKDGSVAKMAKALLSPDEQKRLQQIIDAAAKIEKAVAAKAKPGGVIADAPSMLLSTMAAILGARAGRALNTGTIQAPGFVASSFKRVLNSARARVGDPARRLLIDAMGDKELFEALLRKGESAADQAFIRQQLNAWLLAIGAEQIPDDEPGPTQPRPTRRTPE